MSWFERLADVPGVSYKSSPAVIRTQLPGHDSVPQRRESKSTDGPGHLLIDRLCCLVTIGARLDGKTELIATADGYRESTESWAELLKDLKKRGMKAPELAVGDGALGFGSALRDMFPETRCQRDWVYKILNVLDSMPKSVHPRAKAAIREITEAENKSHA